MAKHTMNKHQIKTMKLRKSKHFVTLENPNGNVPGYHLFPERNTYAFAQDAERRRETIVSYYGAPEGFSYRDLNVVEHGKLPFGRVFRDRCRRNMVSSKALMSDLGMIIGGVFPVLALFMYAIFHMTGLEQNIQLLQIASTFFLIGALLWSAGVPVRAFFQSTKIMRNRSRKILKTV